MIHLTSVFEITVLKLCQYFVLLCQLPFMYQTIYYQLVGQVKDERFVSSIQDIYNLSAMSWCTDPTVNSYIIGLQ